jgi:cell division septum initiation protein DivIVA
MVNKEVREDFNKEFLGYKKDEVDELVNALSDKIQVLTKDVNYLKKELKRHNINQEKILEPADD